MAREDLMKALMQSAAQSQQPAAAQPAGGDALSQVVGGLMGAATQGGGGGALGQVLGGLLGGGQTGGNQGDQVLGALEQIIGGQPGTGQALNPNMGALNMNAGDPVMM